MVIPCFNYGRFLAEALDSVLAQTFSAHEITIVDDGSTDDTVAVARALIAAHPQADIRLISQPHVGAPGHTRNVGIADARGEFIVCLDADDALDAGYLAACVAALDAHPQAAVAYGDTEMFGAERRRSVPPPWDSRVELECNFLDVVSMFRRSVWAQVGGYDVEIGYEDWDFWIGVIEHGWSGVKAEGARWRYRVHGQGVFAGHVSRDQEIKARIILKHPRLYNARQRRWAESVLAGDPRALEAGARQGAMPAFVAAGGAVAPPAGGLPIRSICLITKDYPPSVPGGIPRAVQMQAHRLAAAGVEVHVITCAADGAARVREDEGVIVHEIPEPRLGVPAPLQYLEIPLWSFMAAAKFSELDIAYRFDVVETPDYRGEALHLAPRPQTALVIWLHSTMRVVWDIEPGYVPNPTDDAWHALEMAALERADLLLAPSELLRDTTARFLGDRMRPVELMPYAFECSQFPMRRSGRPGNPLHLVFFGRLEPRKNPELVLRVLAAVRARGIEAELTMVGRDHAAHRRRILEPLQAELGLGKVTYVPHSDADGLRAILASADVAVLPSRFDNSPLTLFEALSSGVPVITSDRVGTASWIEPENGLLALPLEDPQLVASLAADAIADQVWIASGPRAAATMRERFSAERTTGALLDCYARLMEGRRHAGRAAAAVAPAPQRSPTSAPPATVPPGIASPVPPPPTASAALPGARRHAVLAWMQELAADPALLESWAESFDGSDEVTLVIYAPGSAPEEAERLIVPLVVQAGLDGDDAADLLALAVPASPADEAILARSVAVVLSARPVVRAFGDVPLARTGAEARRVLGLSASSRALV